MAAAFSGWAQKRTSEKSREARQSLAGKSLSATTTTPTAHGGAARLSTATVPLRGAAAPTTAST